MKNFYRHRKQEGGSYTRQNIRLVIVRLQCFRGWQGVYPADYLLVPIRRFLRHWFKIYF